jgi:hypothetical protein
MSRSALMKTRPSRSSASQLVSQAWLIQRDALPPTLASMTGCRRCGSRRCGSARRVVRMAALRLGQVMRSPTYSKMVAPAAIGASANTPLPCTPLRRTCTRRPERLGSGASACAVGFIGYIDLVGARVCVCARDGGDCRHGPQPLSPREPPNGHEQDGHHCGEAQRGAGHRARAHPGGGQVRQARRPLRERRLRRHLGGGPPGGDQGARGVRRQARQVELRAPAGGAAALRPGADRQGQDAAERGGQAGQAQGRDTH